MPMWLICSCFSAWCCNASSITICLPLMTTPSITAMSSLNVQYVLMSCSSWFLLWGYPCMTYSMRYWRSWSIDVASCSSCIFIHSGVLVVDCIWLILVHMPVISSSLFLLWFCLETASLPWIGLVQAHIWFSLCIDVFLTEFVGASVIMCYILFEYDNEWFVICNYTYLSHKAIMMEFCKAT